ncbi:MAG: hypothetical protein A2046_04355 [Bacteroidetes bacterium GWA2_30_7]|nr:MAG: hypothetical protein A2046_04355 [Bacteroidetes bacterium GWA2_30_7]
MKSNKIILGVFILLIGFIFTQCKKDEPEPQVVEKNIVPSRFKVDIPESISSENKQTKSTASDTLAGNDIYQHLRSFIFIGESAANIVQNIMVAIAVYEINKPMTTTFNGDKDGRPKNLVVIENSQFENTTYEFQLTIIDANSSTEADGGKAIQVFWNTNPIKGIAILKPYNIDRTSNTNIPNAMYRIDYNEDGSLGYDAHMFVTIAGIPLSTDIYAINTLKMFAGKKADIVDVYGNSNHPNAQFFTNETGFNWAFVASANQTGNVGIAEVGLPPSDLNSESRTDILETNSLYNVFYNHAHQAYPSADSTAIAPYLVNTQAPGYFNNYGFIQGGTAPSSNYTALESRIENLKPFNPSVISSLTLSFKE